MIIETEKQARELVTRLIDKKKTVSTAESCTGGLACAYITAISGASEVLSYGVCTYANAFKHRELAVKNKTLQKYGAVSRETALEMAIGVKKHAGSFMGLSVTGIAGPTGGSIEKPVGTVYIGCVTDKTEQVKKLSLLSECGNDREKIREKTVSELFTLALATLIQEVE